MAGKYRAYPEYKDSGVEWVGSMPSHWGVAGFTKYLDSIVDYRGKTPEKTDDGVFLVTARNIKNGRIDYSLSQEFISESEYEEVMSRGTPVIGDVLFTTEAPLGEVANVDNCEIALAQRIIKFSGRVKYLDNYFLKYQMMSSEFQQSLNIFATGSTAKGIKAERFVYLRLLFPSFIEQQKIANFLDHETAKIDTLIEKQQQLIKLLQEKRQAVISHAVTKGLNPHAPMRDSGVEWLGAVPEGWKVGKTKYFAQLKTGHTPSRSKPEYWENCHIPWISLSDVWQIRDLRNLYISETSEKISEFGLANSAAELLPAGTVIVSRTASVGFSGIMAVPMATTQDFVNWVPGPSLTSEFLLYVFRAMERVFDSLKVGSTHKTIYMPDVLSFTTCIPPLKEQAQIVAALKKQSEVFDRAVDTAMEVITLLQERRTALISAAVTGKIDVRDWQAA